MCKDFYFEIVYIELMDQYEFLILFRAELGMN